MTANVLSLTQVNNLPEKRPDCKTLPLI
jgi:hypothetical protein